VVVIAVDVCVDVLPVEILDAPKMVVVSEPLYWKLIARQADEVDHVKSQLGGVPRTTQYAKTVVYEFDVACVSFVQPVPLTVTVSVFLTFRTAIRTLPSTRDAGTGAERAVAPALDPVVLALTKATAIYAILVFP
jgi:hypothetical protein